MLLLSLWLAVVCNVPLWRAVAALAGQDSLRGWGFALAFALSAPPLLWLQRRPLQRLSALRQLGHNALLLVLVFQDFSSTMRNHTQLRYLINPLNSVYALGDIAAHRLNPENHTLQPVGRDAQLGTSYAGQSAAQAPLLVLVLGETGRSGNYETLLDVLQRAGLAVLWVDNQSGCKGVCDRVEHTSTQCPSGECLDSVLLKDLDERIAALPAERAAVETMK